MLSEYHTNFLKKKLHEHKLLYASIQNFSIFSNTVRSTVTLNIQLKNNILEILVFTESNLMWLLILFMK